MVFKFYLKNSIRDNSSKRYFIYFKYGYYNHHPHL